MTYIALFFKALSLTILIECLIAVAIQSYWGPRLSICPKYSRLLITVALASILTLPYVWFVLPELIKSRFAYEMVSETGVVIVESVFYILALRINLNKALLLSICTNLGSMLIGKLFF